MRIALRACQGNPSSCLSLKLALELGSYDRRAETLGQSGILERGFDDA